MRSRSALFFFMSCKRLFMRPPLYCWNIAVKHYPINWTCFIVYIKTKVLDAIFNNLTILSRTNKDLGYTTGNNILSFHNNINSLRSNTYENKKRVKIRPIHILVKPAWFSNIVGYKNDFCLFRVSGIVSLPKSKHCVSLILIWSIISNSLKRRFLAWLYKVHERKSDTSPLFDHSSIEGNLWCFFEIDLYLVYSCVVI